MSAILDFFRTHHVWVALACLCGAVFFASQGDYKAAVGLAGTAIAYVFPGSPALANLLNGKS